VGSDRARISYDPTRDYRLVVAQQGRVTLEADVNEQNTLASEALRWETIDIVGPAGTPDDGYKVSLKNGALVVGRGTMYLGGWRLELPKEVALASQPDWLDQPPPTTAAGEVFVPPAQAEIALLATEYFISATEDQALREVALGGPDTAARTRLMQHFLEIPTTGDTCELAEGDVAKTLKATGLVYHPKTTALTFDATLEVSFFPPPPPPDPCCPPAQGGYLGSDNQLVEVTVTSYDPASRTGTLLWGWNDASFLYRASLVNAGANPQVLQLSQTPIDAEHTPQPTQAIEVLRTTAVLGNPIDDNCVAALQGEVITLGSGTIFDPVSNQLTLPGGTTLQTDPDTLFVRLWQAEVPFTEGQVTNLDKVSGLAVKVKINALPVTPILARPFWQFAVRPNTPQQVYPQRYLEAPQFPDGPRQWLTSLAVVVPGGPNTNREPVIHDCRKHFLPLTELEGCVCCNLALDPSQDWLGSLNEALASSATALNICFQPGSFTVSSKITITGKSVKMTGAGTATAHGGGPGTLITGPSLESVIEFDSCPVVSLSDLSVVAGVAGYASNPASAGLHGLQGAVTIRSCNQVDIERVSMACADADLRASSCLAIYNPVPSVNTATQQYNVRVLNSQFQVGHFQVGILLVNADRAHVEGNLVVTAPNPLNIQITGLGQRPYIAGRLRKQLLHAMTLVDTAPPTTAKGKKRLLKKPPAKKQSARTVTVAAPPTTAGATAPHPASAPTTPPAAEVPPATPARPAVTTPAATTSLPHLNLGAVGRAHFRATFGTVKLEFISSDKLGNAWNDALQASGLTETSTKGQVHAAVRKIANAIVSQPETVAFAFRNYVEATLPQLFSTSSQGIVVGGDLANDVRILNNTIDGTAQGIHVGLSDLKVSPHQPHLIAERVQICGNTVNIRLTAEMTGDRHGIFLGCVTSGLVSDNHLTLTRGTNAGQDIYAIKIAGFFGPSLLIERNSMLNFTNGLFAAPDAKSLPSGVLWKASDNASTSANVTSFFRVTDNIP
jgi:hypothetical protein